MQPNVITHAGQCNTLPRMTLSAQHQKKQIATHGNSSNSEKSKICAKENASETPKGALKKSTHNYNNGTKCFFLFN